MTEANVRRRLESAIARAGSLRKFATLAGLSPAYVSKVQAGEPPTSPRLLAAIGVQRLVTVSYRAAPGGETRKEGSDE